MCCTVQLSLHGEPKHCERCEMIKMTDVFGTLNRFLAKIQVPFWEHRKDNPLCTLAHNMYSRTCPSHPQRSFHGSSGPILCVRLICAFRPDSYHLHNLVT